MPPTPRVIPGTLSCIKRERGWRSNQRDHNVPALIKPTYFATPAEFRRWLERNHDSAGELWVGFHKKSSGVPSITWPEAVNQVLCFGWIDGVRRTIDAGSYAIRVTPRKPRSNWSAVNIKRAAKLAGIGLMHAAGRNVLAESDAEKSNRYSFEREHVALDRAQLKQFRANCRAWEFFQSQPAGYRKTATWWVVSAKQEGTREKRLATLIADSDAGVRIAQLRRAKK